MKRITILLVALLALVVTACGGGETAESVEPTAEPVATAEPTPEPDDETPEPAESDDDGGADGGNDTALADLLPETVGGQSRTDVDMASNPMFAQMLSQSGTDVSEVEFIISTYGTGTDALSVTSMRIPELGQPELEQIARLMSGASDGQGSAEPGSIGGKEVLILTATDSDEQAYMYFTQGAVFVVAGGAEDLAADLMSQLP